MAAALDELVRDVSSVARETPTDAIHRVADRLLALQDGDRDVTTESILSELDSPAVQAKLRPLLKRALAPPSAVSPAALGLALKAAAVTDDWHRQDHTHDLIWTGPKPPGTTLRRTDQALLELIQAAHRALFLATYAAYAVPTLHVALVHALDRGVHIDMLLESRSDGPSDGPQPAESLSHDLRGRVHIWHWPRAQRKTDPDGRVGRLHAKCAVGDDTHLVVSSANLTGHAFDLNMELGVLLVGGKLPGTVKRHFAALLAQGALVRE